MASKTTNIDPVSGLVSYVEEIKPYHTKIIEVLVEYIHTDCIDVTFTENFELSLGVPANPLVWGWTEEEANRLFNDNWTNYQVSGSGVNYWDVSGNFTTDFLNGEKILVKTDIGFTEYTVVSSIHTSNTTRITVAEPVSPNVEKGAIFHSTAYSLDENTGVYTLKAGLVFPSPAGVEKIGNCGGYGSSFEQLVAAGALVPNAVLTSNDQLNYFEISNTLGTPIPGANTWADILRYGVKVNINGTGNNGTYTVFLSVPSGGSPDTLRVYVLENVAFSEGPGGTLTVREWGYDEPDVCVNQGQSLEAAANISERLEFLVNDVGYNMINGWDMSHWDLGGYDGGPVTIVATLN